MQHPIGNTRSIWAYERYAHFNPNPKKSNDREEEYDTDV